MVKLHLKRHSMPASWPVKRKNIQFVAKPNAGSYKREYVVPMQVLLRDVLQIAHTTKEAKYIVNHEEVKVNGKKVEDAKFPVGIFDVVEIPKTSQKFTILFNEKGRFRTIDVKDSNIYEKVTKKTVLSAKKYQINFMSGHNLLVDEKTFKQLNTGDTIIFDFDKKKVSGVLPLKEGNVAYVFDGNYKGKFGVIKSFANYNGLTRDNVGLEIEGQIQTTAKDYCFVVGTKKEDLKRFD
ncbi:MAG: S4 domain-containing protein [Nanoarchaeota archaeon]